MVISLLMKSDWSSIRPQLISLSPLLISYPVTPRIVVAMAIVAALQATMDEDIIRTHHLKTTERDSSQGQAYFSAFKNSTDANWYPDFGATHHLTSDFANLNVKAEDYSGSDTIRVGNGNGLPI
ncbi:hypothetical protein F0562_017545 [Nyssa sinensis]|uniref:Uncharacterized protein n=1 Tax=Nyssa sinensis TaxID=561372 RepID=A0A5J4ZEZ9_9ASTE|nr:hypothetical protein F0562_017545 [Nyssa sinensis]